MSETPKSWQSKAWFVYAIKLFTLNDFDSQCWNKLSHTFFTNQFDYFIVLRALLSEVFNMFAPYISIFLLVHLWLGGKIVYFLYSKIKQVRTILKLGIYN